MPVKFETPTFNMNSQKQIDIAVVGAGILGLAHAYHFARAGLKVAVFERSPMAIGASIRNFGMVWPIGQPPGEMREIALRSRQIWSEVLAQSGIWHRECGSIHLAYHQDELDVLSEFADKAPEFGYSCGVISPQVIADKSPVVQQSGLLGGLFSPSEICVFPRQVIGELPAYLETLGVEFHFGTAVTAASTGSLIAGEVEFLVSQILLCTGDDFETLFPLDYASMGMTRSKLQMMRMKPKDPAFKIGTHLCAGLTLGHYSNFRICDKLPSLLERYQRDWPRQVHWGIHLLVSQHEDGCLTVGDSHEYGLKVDPFMQEEIDRLILQYLATFLDIRELEIIERWYGVYAKHPSRAYVAEEIRKGIHVVTGVGGAGMTLSFGLAEHQARRIMG